MDERTVAMCCAAQVRSVAGSSERRAWLPKILACLIGTGGVAHAAAAPMCHPILVFKETEFSQMQPPTLERRWSAIVSVDASRCAPHSEGQFEIVFTRLKEIGLELQFRERFVWRPPAVTVKVDFWADEAVEVKRQWIDAVTPCPCRN